MSNSSVWDHVGTPLAISERWYGMFGKDCPVRPPVMYVRKKENLIALIGREPVGHDQAALEDLRWHISVSGENAVPTWQQMVMAAHELRPGVVFCVPMPPRTWWINVQPNTLHLWEIRDTMLETQWRSEGMGSPPS